MSTVTTHRPRTTTTSVLLAVVASVASVAAGCTGATPTTTQVRAAAPSAGAGTAVSSGAWLAYQTAGQSGDRVHVSRLDGSQDHVVAPELPGPSAHPDFSPDGRWLAFDRAGSVGGADQVYVSTADGARAQLVAPCRPPACLAHWEPSWSPDGHRLAVSVDEGPLTTNGPSRHGLAIADPATGEVTPVVVHDASEGQDHSARWSPDGSTLVFWRERVASDGSTQTAVFTVGTNGGHVRQLTPWSLLAGDPDWSPDGSTIVFATRPMAVFPMLGRSELYLMAADGTGVRRLTANGENGPRAGQPRWAPDGRSIVYVQASAAGYPRRVHTVLPDGTSDTPVLTDLDLYTHPVLRPGA